MLRFLTIRHCPDPSRHDRLPLVQPTLPCGPGPRGCLGHVPAPEELRLYEIAIAALAGRVLGFPPSTPRNGFRSRQMLASFNRHLVGPLAAWKAGSPHLKHLRAL